jgi:hypothetical protein
MFTRPYEVQSDDLVSVFAVRFKPDRWYFKFIRIPAAAFCENYIDMESLLIKSFTSFYLRIREQKGIFSMIDPANDYFVDGLRKNKIDLCYLNRTAAYISCTDGLIGTDDLAEKVLHQ